jgi:peptidoglycan/LPS O-acetylase OafA/YrhL
VKHLASLFLLLMPLNNPVLKPLTGVRFLAAFFVFLFHYKPFPEGSFMWGISNEMYTGVQMFFVLSGFLIAYNYYDEQLSASFWKKYLVKRFARIYPVFFVLTLIFFIYRYLRTDTTAIELEVFLNFTLLKGFSEQFYLSGLFQSWSLTVEETFYLLAPFIFLLYKKRKLFWIQALVCLGAGVLLVLFFKAFPFYGFFSSWQFLFTATFFGRVFEFFLGIRLAIWFKNRKPITSKYKFPLFTLSGLLLLFASLVTISLIRENLHLIHGNENVWGLIFANIILPLGTAAFYLGLITETSVIEKFFSSRILVILGMSSYIFYLIHAGLFAETVRRFTTNHVWVNFALLEMISVLGFLFFEKPMNNFIRNLFHVR